MLVWEPLDPQRTTKNGRLWVHPGFQARIKWKAQLQCDARVCLYHFLKSYLLVTRYIWPTQLIQQRNERCTPSGFKIRCERWCVCDLCTTKFKNDKHNVLDCNCSEAMIQHIALHRRKQWTCSFEQGCRFIVTPHSSPKSFIHCFWFALNANHPVRIRRAHGKGGIRRAHGKEHAVE